HLGDDAGPAFQRVCACRARTENPPALSPLSTWPAHNMMGSQKLHDRALDDGSRVTFYMPCAPVAGEGKSFVVGRFSKFSRVSANCPGLRAIEAACWFCVWKKSRREAVLDWRKVAVSTIFRPIV